MTVIEIFLNVLNPDDTTTGGGSASALAGAMAAALLAMAAKVSAVGALAEDGAFFTQVYQRGSELAVELQEGGVKDSAAFAAVRAAYQLPKASEEEKKARQAAVQAAWVQAAGTPLDNARLCLDVIALGKALDGRAKAAVASDCSCARMLARAGLLGCLENVAINLPSIKDAELAGRLNAAAEDLRRLADA